MSNKKLMNNCLYCGRDFNKSLLDVSIKANKKGDYIKNSVFIARGNTLYINTTRGGVADFIEINYCPICGRKLEEE